MNKITNKDVEEMLSGEQNPNFLREGLCSNDVSDIDMSDLDIEHFLHLSFDEDTKFSETQIEKFNPKEILEDGKKYENCISSLHSRGYTGKGVGVAIIDTNIDIKPFQIPNITFKNKNNSGEEETHGATVLSAFLQIAPEANITYFCDDKYNKNRDENIKRYIEEIVKNKDIKIISMSSQIKDENIKKYIDVLLKQSGVTLIDSKEFSENFTYCYRNLGNGEEYKEDYVVSDKYDFYLRIKSKLDTIKLLYEKESKKKFTSKEIYFKDLISTMKNYGLGKNDIEHIENYKEFLFMSEEEFNLFIKDIRRKEIQEEIYERNIKKKQGKTLIEVPCGGCTLFTGSKYKYFSTSSVSYTLPKVSAMYVLAKQANMNINFEQFINIIRETSTNINGRKVISPDKFIEHIRNDFKNNLTNLVVNDEEYINSIDNRNDNFGKSIEVIEEKSIIENNDL